MTPETPYIQGRFGAWTVTISGEISNEKYRVRIHPDRLREPDWWVKLMYSYPWMALEWNDFMPAWAMACELAEISEVKLKTRL
jgi:hypothetical protein